MQDVATKTSKQRFGFFSLPPSSRAANTEYFQKKGSRGDIAASKDENGRVKTKERNIYSGATSSGTLKKSFFQYRPSVFHGDEYMDPGKVDRLQVVKENQENEGKEIFKPNNFSSMTYSFTNAVYVVLILTCRSLQKRKKLRMWSIKMERLKLSREISFHLHKLRSSMRK